MTNYALQIGQVLRYPRASEEPAEHVDGQLNFRKIALFKGGRSFQLEVGVNTSAEIVGNDKIPRRPAILTVSSPHKKGSAQTPWQDYFDSDNGHIRYYGDNKDPGSDPARAPGNKALLAEFQLAHGHNVAIRSRTSPMLFCRRITYLGKSKGFPEFHGFGVIRSVELITQSDNEDKRSYTNYASDFTVLSTDKEV